MGAIMVRLNVIYTRTGDAGESGLGDGTRRKKTDARFVAMGDVDETNCAIGLARLNTKGASDPALSQIEAALKRVQNDLFNLAAWLTGTDTEPFAGLQAACYRIHEGVIAPL
jgi:cob(I)alamin adenosyltransferase